MNINGVNGTGMRPNAAGMGTGAQSDPVSADLQKQIEKLKNDLREMSGNQEMPADAKMKKRQEIQKQISDLEIQLRQHQMEVKKEERQKKKEESSFDDLTGTKPQDKQKNTQKTGMSTGNMEAMISADKAVKQASAQGSVATKMEGRANVLKAEMKLDGGRGGSSNVNLKEEELAKANEAAQKATASQMDSLTQASETMKEASKEDRTDRKEDDDKKTPGTEDEKDKKEETSDAANSETLEESGYVYHPVDVRL